MQKRALFVIGLLFAACSADLPHEAPYDEQAPLNKQAKASLTGKVALEGETDASQVSVQLVNAARTYSVSTHADGAIELTGVVPGKYRVTYETRYFVPQTDEITVELGKAADLGTRTLAARRSGVRGSARVEKLVGAKLQSTGGVLLTLRKSGSIRTGGAKAPAYHYAAGTTAPEYATVSASDGGYTFGEVPAGTYDLVGSAEGIEPAALVEVTVTGEQDVVVEDVVLHPLTGFFTIEGTSNGQVSTVYTQTPLVTLKLSGFNAEKMKIAQSADGTPAGCSLPAAGILFASTQALTLTGGDGEKLVCVRFADAAGKETETLVGAITLDQAAPAAVNLSAVTPNGYVSTNAVLVNVSAADAASGVQAVRYSTNAAGVTAAVATPYQPTLQLPLAADGSFTYWLQVVDAAGNASPPQSVTVVRDTGAPSLGVVVKSGGVAIADNATVGSTRLTLQITATDASPVEVQIVNNGVAGAWEPYSAVRGVELDAPVLPAGEARSLVVRLRDAAGNQAAPFAFNVVVDTVGPTAPGITPFAALVSDTTLPVTLTAVGASDVELSGDISFLAPVRFAYTTAATFTLAAGDGPKTVYARFLDAVGNPSAIVAANTVLDQSAPQNPTLAIAQAGPTNVNPLSLALSATGADFMSVTEGACGNAWEAYAQAKTLPLGSTAEGTKTVAVRYKDQAGNVSACVTKSVYFDANPPVAGVNPVLLNFGAASTSNGTVTVSFNVASATQVKVSEDSGLADAAWQPYSASRTLALSAGNGTKTVYALFRDDAGNTAGPVNDTIVLDTTPISVPYVTIQADATSSTSVLVNLAASNVDEMMLSENAGFTAAAWQPYVGVTTVTFASGDGVKTLYAKFKKSSGAESSVASDTYILDTAGPQLPSVLVNNGASVVSSNIVTLNLTAVDPTSGVAVYKINTANDFSASGDHGYQPSDLYTLSAGDGAKTLWVIYRDRAGNYSSAASTTVVLDSTAPSVSSVQLQRLDGSAIGNGATVRDGRIVLTSSVSDGTPLEMQVTTNGSYAGLGWEPYNPNKVIDLTGVTATLSARVRDAAGQVTSLVSGFTVNLDNTAPSLTFNRASASPTNLLAVSLALAASESSQAQVSEDPGFTGAPWFNTANTTYTLAAVDGLRTIYARVRDAAGNVSDVKTVQVTIDQTAPQGADFTLLAGATTNSRTVALTFTAIGASDVRAQEGASCGGTYASYGPSGSVSLTSLGDGTKSISVQYKDAVGNETACLTKTIALDETPPSVTSVLLDGNAPYTTDRVVSVDIVSSGATQMQVAETSTFSGATWQPVTTSVAFTLSAGEGNKTIFARFRDDANNVVTGFSDSILVDTIAPTFNSLTAPSASAVTGVTLSLTAAGADEVLLSENADFSGAAWQPFAALVPFAIANVQGAHTVYAQLRDTAGNVSIVRSANVTLDSQAPATPLVSVVGSGYTKTATVSLQVLSDGASEMLVSQWAPMTDSTWVPFAQLKSFTFAGSDGLKTVYVQVRDAAGNPSGQGSATITLDSTPPSIGLFRAQDSGGNVITTTNQLRYFLRLDVADAAPVTVQYAPTNVFTGVPAEGYAALRAWDVAAPASPAGETRSAYARVQDAAGNFAVVGPVDVTVDNLGPTAPNLTLAAALVSDATVGVTLSAVDAAEVELSGDISFLAPIRFAYTSSTNYTFPAGDGVKTLYARYLDAQGNASAIVVASTTLDQTPPQNPALTIAQSSPTNVDPLALTLTATGADFMSVTEGACGSVWESYSQTKSLNLASTAEGNKTVAVRFKDTIGNVSACVTKAVYFDATPPSLLANPVLINYGAASTSNGTVEVEFSVAGATQVKVSEDSGLADAAWLPYTATRTFALSAGNGTKHVYAKFRDDAGNEVGPVTTQITLDTTPISVPYVTIQADATSSTTVLVNLAASNIDQMMISEDPAFGGGVWQIYVGVTSVTFSSGDGVKTLYAKFKKTSGAESSVASDTYILDTTGPQLPSVLVNNGASVVSSNIVTLNLTAVDPTSGVAVYKINTANDFSASGDYGYQPSDLYTLAAGDGAKTLWVIYRDRAGNYSSAASTTVLLDSTAPSVASVQVQRLDGSAIGNGATVRDGRIVLTSSVTDLTTLEMQVTTNGSYAGLGWEPYNPNKVIDLTGVTATLSARVRDAAGQVTSLVTGFTVNLDNTAPTLTFNRTSGSPANVLAVSLSLSASESSQAQVSEDPGFTGAPWFNTANTTYTLASGDGLRTIYARAKDAAGNVSDVKTVQVTIDQTAPQGADFTILADATTNSRTVALNFSAIGASDVRAQEGASCGGAYATYGPSGSVSLTSLGDGTKSISVQYKDAVGNETACLTKTIALDETPPSVTSVLLDGNATYTTDRVVSVDIVSSGATQMQVAENSTFSGASWQPVTTSVAFTLSAGEGNKTIFARFRDDANNVVTGFSDSILVDTVAPTFNSLTAPSSSSVTAVTLSLTAAGADEVILSENADFSGAAWQPFASLVPFAIANVQGAHTVYAQLRDLAGNLSIVRSVNVTLDSLAPTTPLVSVVGSGYTKTATVSLQVLSDGANEMLVSQWAPMTDATWVPFAQLKSFTFAGGDGLKSVYVKVRDAAGNPSGQGSATVTLDSTPPSVVLFRAQDSGGNPISVTSQLRYFIRLDVSDASPLTVQYSPVNTFSGVAAEGYTALRAWDVAAPTNAAGEVRQTYVRIVDAAGNEVTPGSVDVTVDDLGPTAPNLTLAAALVSSPTVTVNLSAAGASEVELSGDISFLSPIRFAYTAVTSYTFPAGDGVKTLYARYIDSVGNPSAIVLATTTLDQTAPQLPALAIAQASPTNENPLSLTLSAIGADLMSVTEGACGSVWEAYNPAKSLTLASPVEGNKTVAVRFKDTIGNVSACVTKTVYFDATPPSLLALPVQINYGAASTSNGTVTVSFNVVDATQVKVSEDSGLADAAWQPYSASRTLALSAGNGTKTVYAKFRDDAGNEAGPVNDTIVLDTTPISVPYITIQADATSSTSVLVNLAASNVDEMMVSESATFTAAAWQPYVGVTTVTFSSGDGVKTLYAKFKKSSGAESPVASDSYILDTTGPQMASVLVNNGASVVSSPIVTLNLTAVDPTSGVAIYKINTANDFAAAGDHGYQPSDLYTLAAGDGAKTLWVIYRDRAGNYSSAASTTVLLDSTVPSVVSAQLQKLDGSAIANGATVRDGRIVLTSSVTDLTPLEMQVTTNGSYAGLGWEPYNPSKVIDLTAAASTISVRVRDGAGFVSNVLSGVTVNLDNAPPTLTFNRTSGSPTNSLAVVLSLSASETSQAQVSEDPGFTGAPWFNTANTTYTLAAGDGLRTIYARVKDAAGNVSDVKTVQLTVDQTPPQGASFTLNTGATTNLRTVALTLTAVGATEVRAAEGAACSGAYGLYGTSGSVTLTSPLDGLKDVSVQFRDDVGNTSACLTKQVFLDETGPDAGYVLLDGGAPSTQSRTVSVALSVTGATEMQLAENAAFTGAAWQPATTSTMFTFGSGGEAVTKTLYARFRDGAGNLTGALSDAIVVDTQAPTAVSLTLDGGAEYGGTPQAVYTRDAELAVALAGGNWDLVEVAEDIGFQSLIGTFNSATVFPQTVYLSIGNRADGMKTVFARFRDDAGNVSPLLSKTIFLDTSKPNPAAVLVNGGAVSTKDLTGAVQLSLTAGDTGSGVGAMRLANTYAALATATEEPFTGSKIWPLADPGLGKEGLRTVWFQVADKAGNYADPVSDTIGYDTLAPVATLTPVVFTTAMPSASRTVHAQFQVAGAVEMMLGNDLLFTGRTWEPFTAEHDWTFAAGGDGVTKTLYATFRDAAGNQTGVLTGDATIDDQAPTGQSIALTGGAEYGGSQNLDYSRDLEVYATVSAASWTSAQIAFDPAFAQVLASVVPADTQPRTIWMPGYMDGSYSLYVRFYDDAGNVSQTALDSITVDSLPPVINTATLNGHNLLDWEPAPWAVTSVAGTASLHVTATDLGGAPATVTFDEGFGSSEVAFNPMPKTITVRDPGTDRSEMRYPLIVVRDAAGNQDARSGHYQYLTYKPSVVSPDLADAAGNFVGIANQLPIHVRGTDAQMVAQYQISEDPTFQSVAWTNRPTNGSGNYDANFLGAGTLLVTSPIVAWPYPQGDAFQRYLYLRVRDMFGNTSDVLTVNPRPFQFDATPPPTPTVSVTRLMVSGMALEYSWTIPSNDAMGAVAFEISTDSAFPAGQTQRDTIGWMQLSGTGWHYPVSLLPGAFDVFFRTVDQAGNTSPVQTVHMMYDPNPPVLSDVVVNGGAFSTNSAWPRLSLTAFDPLPAPSGLTKVIYAVSPSWWSVCRDYDVPGNRAAYAADVSVDASAIMFEGWVNLSVCVLDAAGNGSPWVSRGFLYDKTPPMGISLQTASGLTTVGSQNVALAATHTDWDTIEVMLSNDPNYVGAVWQATGASIPWLLTPGDGTKTVYAKFRDPSGNEAATTLSLTLDATPPAVGSLVVNSGAPITNATTLAFTLSATEAYSLPIEMQFGSDPGFSNATWIGYASSGTTSIPAGDGYRTIYVRFRDSLGNTSAAAAASFTLDQTGPQLSFLQVNGDSGYTAANVPITFQIGNWSAGDQLQVAQNAAFTGATAYAANAGNNHVSYTLTGADGPTTVYVRGMDSLGNFGPVYAEALTKDTAPPSVVGQAIAVNGTAQYATGQFVALTLSAAGATEMLLANDAGFTGAQWEPYAASSMWVLPSGDGVKWVYVKFRDQAGNATGSYADAITLDTGVPAALSVRINDGAPYAITSTVQLSLAAVGATKMELSTDGVFDTEPVETFAATVTPFSLAAGQGTKFVYARFSDAAGNLSNIVYDDIQVDTQGPTGSDFTIDEAPMTPLLTIHLSLTSNGATEMQISEGGCVGLWTAYSTTASYNFQSSLDGVKTMYVRFRDPAGNLSACLSKAISLDTTAPSISSLAPRSAPPGRRVTINGLNFGVSGSMTIGGAAVFPDTWSNSEIKVDVPDVAPGAQVVIVTSGGKTAFASINVLPRLDTITPNRGPVGQTMVVTGTAFGAPTGAITVDGMAVTVSAWSNTSATFTLPAVAAGARPVVVTAAVGGASSQLFVHVRPVLSSVTPASGAGGSTITLGGSNFGASQGASRVYVGGRPAAVTAWSANSIQATVPAGMLPVTHAVSVNVGLVDSNAKTFTQSGARVDSRTPHQTWGGRQVTLRGSGFGISAGTVTIGGVAAAIVSWTATQVVVTAPAGPAPGAQPIVLTPSSGAAANVVPIDYRAADSWAVSSFNLSERRKASAVWTGTEMIVWGGVNAAGTTQFNTGARFNPATDTWIPLPLSGAPTARHGHTAVWTGKEMIVWGGISGATPTNTGAKYDILSNTWAGVSGTGAPVGASGHTAVWSGTEMIVWGGADAGGFFKNTGGRYDPVLNQWVATSIGANVPSATWNHVAVWAGKEMLVWGGIMAAGARYNPLTDAWIPMAPSPLNPRELSAAVWTGADMVVWSGTSMWGVSNAARYSPAADQWSLMNLSSPDAPGAAREGATVVWTGDAMLVWGGALSFGGVDVQDTGSKYDPATDTWAAIATAGAPTPRAYHASAWTGSRLVVWGGSGNTATSGKADGGVFDSGTNTWPAASLAGTLRARTLHTTVWTGSELFVWGGLVGGSATNTGERYDPARDTIRYVNTAGAPSARRRAAGMWTGSKVIVWGSDTFGAWGSGGQYDPASDSWTTIGGTMQENGKAVWTGTYMVAMQGYSSTTDRYNPVTDLWVGGTAGPFLTEVFASSGATLTWTGSEVLVYGNKNGVEWIPNGACFGVGSFTNNVFHYNPNTDTWITAPRGGPSSRDNHSAVWTGSRLIIFGGEAYSYIGDYYDADNDCWGQSLSNPVSLSNGWEYNPATQSWTQEIWPRVYNRKNHSAVWDGSGMIVFGTVAGVGERYSGANTWTYLSSIGAPAGAREDLSAIWDGSQMVVFGGSASDSRVYFYRP